MARRILVIDDDDGILEMYRLLLALEGYDVHLSTSIYQNLKDIDTLHLDLIILDFKFGRHLDRSEFLHQLKMYPPTAALPVIVCTAATREIDEQEKSSLQAKGIPLVFKPFDIDDLLRTIQQVLEESASHMRSLPTSS